MIMLLINQFVKFSISSIKVTKREITLVKFWVSDWPKEVLSKVCGGHAQAISEECRIDSSQLHFTLLSRDEQFVYIN
jgi:hypothetical protein